MTFSVFNEQTPLLEVADVVREKMTEISRDAQLAGYEISLLLTRREEDGDLSHALLSTIDDHEELLSTLDEAVGDILAPYVDEDSGDEDDEPELPFEKATIQ